MHAHSYFQKEDDENPMDKGDAIFRQTQGGSLETDGFHVCLLEANYVDEP